MMINQILNGNSLEIVKNIPDNSIHLILSDIPYGISFADWDILHNNTNSALLGTSPAQAKAGGVFKRRGKPLNGWSKADKQIPREYYQWCSKWTKDWLRVLKPGSSVFIFAGRRLAHRCICAMEDAGFIYKDMISWEKDTAPFKAQRVSLVCQRRDDIENAKKWAGWRLGNLRPSFEPILWFMKPYQLGGTLTDNIIQYGVGGYNYNAWHTYNPLISNLIKVSTNSNDHGKHPTQKPIKLIEALIELTTQEGQVILDPFCGSGSTLVAAKKLNREYIGIELSDEFCQIARERLKAETN